MTIPARYTFTKSKDPVGLALSISKQIRFPPGHAFGETVAIDGDTIVVGAPYNKAGDGYEHAGAVYVFERTLGVWLPKTTLRLTPGQRRRPCLAIASRSRVTRLSLEHREICL